MYKDYNVFDSKWNRRRQQVTGPWLYTEARKRTAVFSASLSAEVERGLPLCYSERAQYKEMGSVRR